jgi:hypothetical protein
MLHNGRQQLLVETMGCTAIRCCRPRHVHRPAQKRSPCITTLEERSNKYNIDDHRDPQRLSFSSVTLAAASMFARSCRQLRLRAGLAPWKQHLRVLLMMHCNCHKRAIGSGAAAQLVGHVGPSHWWTCMPPLGTGERTGLPALVAPVTRS